MLRSVVLMNINPKVNNILKPQLNLANLLPETNMIPEQSRVIYTKACGKVLIAGGYGVLEKQNIGLTLGLENYFFCKLEHIPSFQKTSITVESPQIHKKYHYTYNEETKRLQQTNSQENIFVENALYYSLQYFNLLQNSGHLKLTITFDKGFISQKSATKTGSKFLTYSQNYSKTGLGSSACVVVSIVSAICALMDHKQNKLLVNIISQVANLSAQKKIGSNFDISTAVFGTHLYKNVLPEMAFKCIEDKNWSNLLEVNSQIEKLTNVNQLIRNDSIGFMIDVSKGANTRVMVSNFLKNLRLQDEAVQKQFFAESKVITQKLYNIFCNQSQDKHQILKLLRQVNHSHRKLQQKFSKITKTPVEPEQFEGFLNDLMLNENVFYVICPGSGGFDALFMLASKEKNQEYYQKLIESLSKKHQVQLGKDVSFSLKKVNIKWENSMQVTKQQEQLIQEFLKNLNSIQT